MKVTIKANCGAGIYAGDQLTDPRGTSYEAVSTDWYADGAEVEIRPIGDPAMRPLPGVELTWVAPRPGCAAAAKVVQAITRADFDRLEARLAAVEAVNADLLGRLERAVQMLADLPAKVGGSLKLQITAARHSS